jgi:hypothetical protein
MSTSWRTSQEQKHYWQSWHSKNYVPELTAHFDQADNGQYSDKEFFATCNNLIQTIEFCGVGAHHQNGTVKKKK